MKKESVMTVTNEPNGWMAYAIFPMFLWILLGVGFGIQNANSLSEFVGIVLHTSTYIYSAAIHDIGPTETGRTMLLFVFGFHLVIGTLYHMLQKIGV